MKKLLTVSVLALASITSVAQVRVIDSPYPKLAASSVPAASPIGVYSASPELRQGFEVSASDVNFRRTFVRWTKMVGWTFEPEHWVLDRDIPVSGAAALGSDFKAAVRGMMASTEFTDLPAQPCFYSNNVLRIIPLNELCSRQQATKTQ